MREARLRIYPLEEAICHLKDTNLFEAGVLAMLEQSNPFNDVTVELDATHSQVVGVGFEEGAGYDGVWFASTRPLKPCQKKWNATFENSKGRASTGADSLHDVVMVLSGVLHMRVVWIAAWAEMAEEVEE